MNIYIAGSSEELDRCELWIARVKDAGFNITLDWTIPIREKGSGNDLPFVEKRKYAKADRDAIFAADALWFLVPREKMSFGAAWEFGLACALHQYGPINCPMRHVVLSGPKSGDHIFTTLADMSFQRDEDAFEYLLRAS